ncbi:hypothetical protein Taro_023004 [Colocasia esculenta]|uniref:type I protein arginine methyltransferase n=1 Tax=Colocasia esculenta TaxID=4460 RepID=A0A843V2R6_COLES|nr:hypothetical protein [Colocasia esculenta]
MAAHPSRGLLGWGPYSDGVSLRVGTPYPEGPSPPWAPLINITPGHFTGGHLLLLRVPHDERTWVLGVFLTKTQSLQLENGALSVSKSKFDDKIEAASAKMYFHYYGQLLHQQNMLQDYVRTGTYYAAVIENRADFHGRVVVDVGAGSGILSLFAAQCHITASPFIHPILTQAGAKHVYAVEASEMAEYAHKLIAGNPSLGTLLVNERMLESYVIARDRFLVPNGKMFPSVGRGGGGGHLRTGPLPLLMAATKHLTAHLVCPRLLLPATLLPSFLGSGGRSGSNRRAASRLCHGRQQRNRHCAADHRDQP